MSTLTNRIRWGVIEDARARQRRERRAVRVAIITFAAVVGLIVWASTGSGGSRAQHLAGSSARPTQSPRTTLSACVRSEGEPLSGRPSQSLLAILGVLRRPATSPDALPAQVPRTTTGGVFGDSVYTRYVRRVRVVAGVSYYVFPVRLSGCRDQAAHDAIWELATHVPSGRGLYGSDGGGGGTAAAIEEGREPNIGPPGSSTSTTVSIIVPDGVAAVTLHFVAGPANGFHKRTISPPYTVTTRVVNNVIVVRVPRSSGTATAKGDTMTWHAANGRLINTFNRL
jgi:hypothetical protein